MRPALEIVRPTVSTPVLYDSPHSGRHYPDDFASDPPRVELRRGEDAYVDRLLSDAPAHGATVIAAIYPRCYIDVNRADDDIDSALLAEPWPGPLTPTEKSTRGLGLIRRYVTPGVEAQPGLLTVREVRARLENVYRPYHQALGGTIAELRERHGFVWHLDWHSMKSVGNAMTPDGEGIVRPDFVVSDVLGTSASPGVTSLIVETLRGFGYIVSINDPYTGGTIVQRFGNPAHGVHSVQVEINRRLYLDEATVEQTAEFKPLANRLAELTDVLRASAIRDL